MALLSATYYHIAHGNVIQVFVMSWCTEMLLSGLAADNYLWQHCMSIGACSLFVQVCAGWTQTDGKLHPAKQASGPREAVTIVRRFHFSSSLKRMSCIVKVGSGACYFEVSVQCMSSWNLGTGMQQSSASSSRRCLQVENASSDTTEHWVVVKGAPEVILERLDDPPAQYESYFKSYAAQGAR